MRSGAASVRTKWRDKHGAGAERTVSGRSGSNAPASQGEDWEEFRERNRYLLGDAGTLDFPAGGIAVRILLGLGQRVCRAFWKGAYVDGTTVTGEGESKAIPALPALDILHERHRGLTQAVCASYSEAAGVCLSRHHTPPIAVAVMKTGRQYSLSWRGASGRENAAWANRDDATRDGAYSISIATIESEYSLFAVSRAETRTGADYYLSGEGETDNLDNSYRLEVSGTDSGDISQRLKEKVKQTRAGESDRPAIACVVRFCDATVAIERVEGEDAAK